MHVVIPTVAAAVLFATGTYGVLRRRNAILVLISVELMLNGVNLDLISLNLYWRDAIASGQVLALFVITIAAAEVGVGVAIVLLVFRTRGTIDMDQLRELSETNADPQ